MEIHSFSLPWGGKKEGRVAAAAAGGGVQLKKIPMSKAWRGAKTGRGGGDKVLCDSVYYWMGGGGEKKVNVSKKKVCMSNMICVYFIYKYCTYLNGIKKKRADDGTKRR